MLLAIEANMKTKCLLGSRQEWPCFHSADARVGSTVWESVKRLQRVLPILLLWLPLIQAPARGDDLPETISLFSATYPPYVRTVLPDGTLKPQTYAFGEGGSWNGHSSDPTAEAVNFTSIVQLLAPELAKKNYFGVAGQDPKRTDLLIMVYWGTTDTPSSSSEAQIARQVLNEVSHMEDPYPAPTTMIERLVNEGNKNRKAALKEDAMFLIHAANRRRDRQAAQNADLLGYVSELRRVAIYHNTAFSGWRDVASEIEEGRYFVVLLAFDFQSLWRAKEKKLLWQTRLSIRAHRSDFAKQLAGMLRTASPYFGRDSGRLIRESLPETNVRLGEMKVVETDVGGKK